MTDFWPRVLNFEPRHDVPDGEPHWQFPGPCPRQAAVGLMDFVDWLHNGAGGKYESPIEERMGAALYSAFKDLLAEDHNLIVPQHHIGKYRADFVVRLNHNKTRLHGLVVECDGRDFHNAVLDARRDRELNKRGYIVMRFTGSQIYRDGRGCGQMVRVEFDRLERGRVVNG